MVYEQGDLEGMLYRVKEKLMQKSECSLLVATSDALLLCQVIFNYLCYIIIYSHTLFLKIVLHYNIL